MTSNSKVFKNEFDDKWYYWDESWSFVSGPFEEYIEAHKDMSRLVEEARGKEPTQSRC